MSAASEPAAGTAPAAGTGPFWYAVFPVVYPVLFAGAFRWFVDGVPAGVGVLNWLLSEVLPYVPQFTGPVGDGVLNRSLVDIIIDIELLSGAPPRANCIPSVPTGTSGNALSAIPRPTVAYDPAVLPVGPPLVEVRTTDAELFSSVAEVVR